MGASIGTIAISGSSATTGWSSWMPKFSSEKGDFGLADCAAEGNNFALSLGVDWIVPGIGFGTGDDAVAARGGMAAADTLINSSTGTGSSGATESGDRIIKSISAKGVMRGVTETTGAASDIGDSKITGAIFGVSLAVTICVTGSDDIADTISSISVDPLYDWAAHAASTCALNASATSVFSAEDSVVCM